MRRKPCLRAIARRAKTAYIILLDQERTVAAVSDRRAKARIVIAFVLLVVVAAALAVGVYYLGKLQEIIANQESRTAVEAIGDGRPIDEALAKYPSNRFLKLMAIASKAALETSAASQKLSQEIEPPALAKDITLAAASRSDLEALRRDLKIAEANATTFMPRYLALLKAERDRLQNDARSLNLDNKVVGRLMEAVDGRHAAIAALVSSMLAARAEYYRAYDKCTAALIAEFGRYRVTNGQFIFPIQYMADRYNAAANAMTSAAKRVAELEEQRKALAESRLTGWEPFVGGK
jgi:hypothetical protein